MILYAVFINYKLVYNLSSFVMRNWKMFILLLNLFLLIWFSFGYQQQWFSQYQEWWDWISFNCTNQCVITLWQKDKLDYLDLEWTVKWNWVIGYWFLIWDQISLLNQYEVVVSSDINDSMNFVEYKQYFSSIPWNTDLILLVNGNLNWNLKLDSGKFSFWKKLSQWWKDFRKMETYTPYSINLRYWITLMWTSIIKYWYILFIIVAILILIFKKWKKEQKFRIIFYLWLWMFLFIWIRNIITYTSILNQGLSWFKEDKTYFDLWDYIDFTDKIRTELNLDSEKISKDDCKIFIDSFQDRPFVWHRESLYLKPCERVLTWDLADYKIYYKTQIPAEDSNKKILIDFNNNYLLENNSK